MATPAASATVLAERPDTRVRTLAATGVVGAVATAAAVWATWLSPIIRYPETTAVVKGLIVASYVSVGAYTWWRRPHSRLGPLVAGAGLLGALTALAASKDPLPFTLGRVALAVIVAYFVHLFLCFPRDRIDSALERWVVLSYVAASTVVWALVLLFAETLPRGGPYTDCMRVCPENALQLVDSSETVTRVLGYAANALSALAVGVLTVLLARKARSPARLRRRAVVPLLIATILFMTSYAAYSLLTQAGSSVPVVELMVVSAVGALGIPLALLVGQFRGRLFAATALWQSLARPGSARVTRAWVEDFLRRSLGDPSFALGVWDPERNGYVDARGAPLVLPERSSTQTVTRIDRDGRPRVALIHDPSLDDEPDVIEGLGATAVTLLENESLVDELRGSQERIVESAERERRRLERDLHDGAQQRLLAIQVKLELARERADDGELAAQLEELASDASLAADELRTIARGIYPRVLHERGLGAALQAVASKAPVPVRVVDHASVRAAPRIESAVYYSSLEAIQNAVRHGGPGVHVVATLTRRGDRIDFEVKDDGAGFDGAAPSDGTGLTSIRDRVGAVGGILWVASSPGAGTIVAGSVPLGQEAVAGKPASM